MITGELVKNKIIIKKPKEASKLYNKNCFGKILSDNTLELNYFETFYLLDQKKLTVYKEDERIDLGKLIEMAAEKIPDFITKYLVFKDLRKRGYIVKNFEGENSISFQRVTKTGSNDKQFLVSVFSEVDTFDLKKIIESLRFSYKQGKLLWFAILDEEGDITYYDVSKVDFYGEIKNNVFEKNKAVFLKNKILVFDEGFSRDLFEKEFFGKPFESGLQLSFVESLYLSDKGFLDVFLSDGKKLSKKQFIDIVRKTQPDIDLRFTVFKDLKKRGFIVKTGFKFGSHFRVYTKHPDVSHAEYLVHVVDKDFSGFWSEISRAVRLAHSVNKEIVFAIVDKEIDYVKLVRLRP